MQFDLSSTKKLVLDLPLKVVETVKKLQAAGYQAYIVGGAVRDLLQNKEVHDWDFTTDATPEQIQKIFPGSFYDNQFGTVGIVVNEEIYEITAFRTEFGYADRRRPDRVIWGKTLEEDLGRRDFTINSLALKITNSKLQIPNYQTKIQMDTEIIDPYNGQIDLENKIIRAVGNPDERFNEDALRMMRAIRIGTQLGFSIEMQTLEAIKNNCELIKHVSWERIRDELLKIIGSQYPADGVLILYNTGLLDYVLPELVKAVGVKQAGHHIYDVFTHAVESLRNCPSDKTMVRLATLLHDAGKPIAFRITDGGITFYGHEVAGGRIVKQIADRLRLSTDQKEELWTLVRWHMFAYQPEMTDAAIRRFMKRVGRERIQDIMALRVGDRKGGGSRETSWRLQELQKRIEGLMHDPLAVKDLKVDGHDVMEILSIKPSPRIGEILNKLFEEVLEDPERNGREYLLKRIRELAVEVRP